jgi:hypothetical protein
MVVDAVRRTVGTRPRIWLLLVTLLAGAGTAAAVAAGTRLANRTFAVISVPTQSLMSVAVPLLGILLIFDARQRHRLSPIIPTLAAAVATGIAIGLLGVLFCLVATAVAPSAASPSRWSGVGTIALGSALVQVVPSLVGTGLGLLLRWRVVAFLATIVLPLGLWFVLGAVDLLRPAQAWLTPYPLAQHLLSGAMSAENWAQWLVVLLVWGVGLNAVGRWCSGRRRQGGH